jgi:hypothetical protein
VCVFGDFWLISGEFGKCLLTRKTEKRVPFTRSRLGVGLAGALVVHDVEPGADDVDGPRDATQGVREHRVERATHDPRAVVPLVGAEDRGELGGTRLHVRERVHGGGVPAEQRVRVARVGHAHEQHVQSRGPGDGTHHGQRRHLRHLAASSSAPCLIYMDA